MNRVKNVKAIVLLLFSFSIVAAVTIFTDDFDNSRLNWNANEVVLTPTSVQSSAFGKVGTYAVDGFVYGRPLYLPNTTISSTVYNVLIVATMHNSIYAFNADSPGSAALWHVGPLATSRTSYPNGGNFFYGLEVGCLATPVVDVVNNLLYVLCTNSTPTWVLYKLNLSTGATVGSVVLSGQVIGTGDSTGPTADLTSGANLLFYPDFELGRAGLTLASSNVYAAFSGYDDVHPWHGWVIGYGTSSLTQIGIWCTTPNGYGGGVWQSSGGTADSSGNMYFATGNGNYDGTANFANSVVKLSSTVALSDWYTPTNWAALSAADADISSGRPMLIPSTNLLTFGMKDFNVYSINSTCMGQLGGTVGGCTAPQIFATGSGTVSSHSGVYGGMYMNGVGYFPNVVGSLYGFSLSGSTWNTTPLATTSSTYAFPGIQITGSSNGASTGVVWGLSLATGAYNSGQVGVLRAFDPSSLNELWNSSTLTTNNLGQVNKFASPVVANGRVYVNASNNVVVFGLAATGISSTQGGGNAVMNGQAVIH